jgi:hypothetical protein
MFFIFAYLQPDFITIIIIIIIIIIGLHLNKKGRVWKVLYFRVDFFIK